MQLILDMVLIIINIYISIVIATAIFSWLLAFKVINFNNEIVRLVWNFLLTVTEPALRPIRNLLPNLGGVDVSPVILLLAIYFVQQVIIRYIYIYTY